jgi:hypothetical protein
VRLTELRYCERFRRNRLRGPSPPIACSFAFHVCPFVPLDVRESGAAYRRLAACRFEKVRGNVPFRISARGVPLCA